MDGQRVLEVLVGGIWDQGVRTGRVHTQHEWTTLGNADMFLMIEAPLRVREKAQRLPISALALGSCYLIHCIGYHTVINSLPRIGIGRVVLSLLFPATQRAVERVIENVAQRKQASELLCFVDNDKPVDT